MIRYGVLYADGFVIFVRSWLEASLLAEDDRTDYEEDFHLPFPVAILHIKYKETT